MWSAAPAVKEGHQLRTSGPYAITRHPIVLTLVSAVNEENWLRTASGG